jgi:hypothetical protein
MFGGTQSHNWLRHYAASRKVAGSNPDEVYFFNLSNPSSRTMALGSTQALREMSTRNLPGGKGQPVFTFILNIMFINYLSNILILYKSLWLLGEFHAY